MSTEEADPLLNALQAALARAQVPAPQRLQVAAGKTFARAGQAPAWLYYVLSGEVRLIRHTPDGRVAVMQRVQRGPVAEASLESRRYHCDVVSATATCALRLPIDTVREAIDAEPELRRLWMQRLTREVIRLRATVERLSLDTAVDRIAHAITLDGRDFCLTLRGTRRQWAEELGLSHEALYRALRRMKDAGRLAEPQPGRFQLMR
jgi:CRP-like cAMP-binding protein